MCVSDSKRYISCGYNTCLLSDLHFAFDILHEIWRCVFLMKYRKKVLNFQWANSMIQETDGYILHRKVQNIDRRSITMVKTGNEVRKVKISWIDR